MLLFYLISTLALFTWLIAESIILSKARQRIPLRILVNGTRGKTSLVRLVHELLTGAGMKVYAKTTGDKPLSIDPSGKMTKIQRLGPASIIENVTWLRKISGYNPDAVVLECMALQPETQRVLSNRIFKPHYTIITNIYKDHAEIMGNTLDEMSRSIGECIPNNTHVILHHETFELLQASGVAITNYSITEKMYEPAPESEDLSFLSTILNHQRMLLRRLAQYLNINTATIDSVIRDAWIKNNILKPVYMPEQSLQIYDLFSVNDTESAGYLLNQVMESTPESKHILILNTRRDRPLRTKDFCRLIKENFRPDLVWLTGSGSQLAERLLGKDLPGELLKPSQIIARLNAGFSDPAVLIGIGNHKGMEPLIQFIKPPAERNSA